MTVDSPKLVASDVVSMTTSMLEFDDELIFVFVSYLVIYIVCFLLLIKIFHMSHIDSYSVRQIDVAFHLIET
jgi:hypothetical protein